MLDRLRAALIACILALGLLAGGGSVGASELSANSLCMDQTTMPAGHSPSAQECGNGAMDGTCGVHLVCTAIVAGRPGIELRDRNTVWFAAMPSALIWTRLPPETPPPIALL